MAERVLTERELNRALLARQLLLERRRLPVAAALERIGGVQNQYAPNGYIRLSSSLEGFRRDDLTRALERRTVVQATLMRVTIHLVSARELWLYALGLRRARREWWLKQTKADERELVRGAERLRAALADGPKRAKELGELAAGFLGHVGLWVDLVRIPPSGTWERRRADLLGLAEDWVGPCDATEEEGLEHLVRSYLRGFGPAARSDVASWTGVPVTMLGPVLERLDLRRFRDERGRELLDLPRAPLPPADVPAPVRFLPTWDATLLVHARRTQILPEAYRARIFHVKAPHSFPTFLVDGQVAGTWRHVDGRIEVDPFRSLPRDVRRELADEGERLAALHA
jgi:hypothetical protein